MIMHMVCSPGQNIVNFSSMTIKIFKSYFQLNLQGTDISWHLCISCNCGIIQFIENRKTSKFNCFIKHINELKNLKPRV